MYYNPYLVIPFAAWVTAQTIKFIVKAAKGDVDFKYFYASGGMPSAHAAVVCALAVTTVVLHGPQSFEFGLSALLAAVVMYDSMGVRRSAGEQASALNALIQKLSAADKKLSQPRLREIFGHHPLEVVAGGALGALLAAVLLASRLQPQVQFLGAVPQGTELWAYLGLFAALVVGSLAARFILIYRHPDVETISRLAKHQLVISQTVGWTGLFIVFLQYQRAHYLSSRFFSLLVILLAVPAYVRLYRHYAERVPRALAEAKRRRRKRKWFETGKKKRSNKKGSKKRK